MKVISSKTYSLIIILTFYLLQYVYADVEIVPFTPAKPISGLSYISQDGKTSYYKQRSNVFSLVKNNKSIDILKSENEFHLYAHTSFLEKRIALEVDDSYYHNFNAMKDNDIYLGLIGDTEIKKVGKGTSPKLHLNDSWLSFYSMKEKKIYFYFVPNESISFHIQLANPISNYFIPDVVMLNAETIVFSDINQKAIQAIKVFNPISESFESLHISDSSNSKLSLCIANSQVIIADFQTSKPVSTKDQSGKSQFLGRLHLPINLKKSPPYKTKVIYENQSPHIGAVSCIDNQEHIYFIKSFSLNKDSLSPTDISRFSLSDMKYQKISQQLNPTHITTMGKRIFFSVGDKMYSVKKRREK